MDLRFNTSLAEGYKSKSQIARRLTEDWLVRNMYCPICGNVSIKAAEANAPVKDCVCENCKSQYELKSGRGKSARFNSAVNDGVYNTMVSRLTSLDNPSFFFLHYDKYEVNNLIIVPKCFFTPEIIRKRKPLRKEDRRAGWEGCTIQMKGIPDIAKIPIIKNGVILPEKQVIVQYNKVYNLQTKSLEGRGWLVDTLHCVEKLGTTFTLDQMYKFVDELQLLHPNNNHIQDKIRQQLQYLRDKGFLDFKGRGVYRRL